MHKSVKRVAGIGILGGAAYAAWRAWNARVPQRPRGVEWSSAPFPFPPVPHSQPQVDSRSASPPVGSAAVSSPVGSAAVSPPVGSAAVSWVEPNADGSCPESHPIKAKLASGIYHSPGGANYARTKADRCYADAAAAEADGMRPSKV